MTQSGNMRHGSATGAAILIGIGVFFLILNFRPNFHPWAFLERYWPVLLIILGLGKLWDYYAGREHPEMAGRWGFLGTVIVVLVAVVFATSVAHWGRNRRDTGWSDHRLNIHEAQSVDFQGAQSVTANIQMPAGSLELGGGSNELLDANFSYTDSQLKPRVAYAVDNGRGQLSVTSANEHSTFDRKSNDWNLHFGDTIPLDLNLDMGAGQSDMKLGNLNLTKLNVNIGAGQMDLDLTGDRKNDLQARIEGGAGLAKIRLPKNIGVRVHASGGIGSIDSDGLKRDGDAYVNEAYGKTPATITLNIEGGVGEIRLEQEP